MFKAALQELVNEIGLEVQVGHYPPACSKYNPIEHRLFPHVTRACQGVTFVSVELVKELIERTKTKTGLTVTVDIISGNYPTGAKAPPGFKENMTILFDDHLPKWNYRVIPSALVARPEKVFVPQAHGVPVFRIRTVIEFSFLNSFRTLVVTAGCRRQRSGCLVVRRSPRGPADRTGSPSGTHNRPAPDRCRSRPGGRPG